MQHTSRGGIFRASRVLSEVRRKFLKGACYVERGRKNIQGVHLNEPLRYFKMLQNKNERTTSTGIIFCKE